MSDSAPTIPAQFKAILEDDYDTRRLLAKVLYLMANRPKRRKLPAALEPHVERFTAGQAKVTIGDSQYGYQELLEITLDELE